METGTASAIAVLLMAGFSMKSHIISMRLITLSARWRAGFLSIIVSQRPWPPRPETTFQP
jgi:hypothetical protein